MSMLEEEPVAPGEVALEDDKPDLITTATTVSEDKKPEAEAETVVTEEPKRADKTGLLAEMIEHRTVRKQLENERQQLAPVLSRLTPELQAAIAEGRVTVRPQATTSEARTTQLEAVAKRLDLYKDDGQGNRVPDTAAAAKVDGYVRELTREAVAPLQQMTLNKDAQANIDTAMKFAEEHGYDLDTIRETYANALRAPNGAAMVANADVAKELWFSAVGRATSAGKMPKAPAVKADDGRPAAIVSESTGRRGPSAGVQLTPALAGVYKQHGLDPNKAHSATHKIDFTQGVQLE